MNKEISAYSTVASLFALATLFAFLSAPHAQTEPTSVDAALHAMEIASGAPAEATFTPVTGLATFVATKVSHPIPVPGLQRASLEKISGVFFSSYGAAFVINEPSQLKLRRFWGPDEVGMHHVRYKKG